MAGPSLHRHHGRCIVEMGVGRKGFKRVPQQVLTRLFGAAFNPEPEGTRLVTLHASDGIALRAAFWPAYGTPRGTLLVLQGRSETIEKYFETITEWQQRGFAVFAFDWRGQGGSERLLEDPRKGHVNHFSDYQLDLNAAMEWLRKAHAPQPFYGFGHSMGGAILLDALSHKPDLLARAVTTAPMLDIVLIDHPRLAGALARALTRLGMGQRFVPGGSPMPVLFKPFADNILTRDAKRHERSRLILDNAPQIALGDPTIQWVATSFQAMRRISRAAALVSTPLLGIASAHDRVTSTQAAQAFFDAVPHGEFLSLSDCEHEILIETDAIRAWFWRAFDAFMAEGEV
jgi:lysophospholipase